MYEKNQSTKKIMAALLKCLLGKKKIGKRTDNLFAILFNKTALFNTH